MFFLLTLFLQDFHSQDRVHQVRIHLILDAYALCTLVSGGDLLLRHIFTLFTALLVGANATALFCHRQRGVQPMGHTLSPRQQQATKQPYAASVCRLLDFIPVIQKTFIIFTVCLTDVS